MAFIHNVINSPYHKVTLSSIHPAINSHLPCHTFTMSSSQDHGPCHSFTMSSIHRLSQSPSHSGPISSYHPQVMRPEELNQKEVLVLLETTLARGRSSSPFFSCATFTSCSHHPTLTHSTANNHLPYSLSKIVATILFILQYLLLYQTWIKRITKTIFNPKKIANYGSINYFTIKHPMFSYIYTYFTWTKMLLKTKKFWRSFQHIETMAYLLYNVESSKRWTEAYMTGFSHFRQFSFLYLVILYQVWSTWEKK